MEFAHRSTCYSIYVFFCYDLEEDGFSNGEGGLVLLLLLPLQVGRPALPATGNKLEIHLFKGTRLIELFFYILIGAGINKLHGSFRIFKGSPEAFH